MLSGRLPEEIAKSRLVRHRTDALPKPGGKCDLYHDMESVPRMKTISDKAISAFDRPYVRARVTLLPELKRGRSWVTGHYQPHVVVGPPTDHTPPPPGSKIAGDCLGVEFCGGAHHIGPGQTAEIQLVLFKRGVNYSAVVRGATFTVLEGPAVVGYGYVI